MVDLLEPETVLLAVTQVHAQQHLRPVLRLGAAGAGWMATIALRPSSGPGQLELEVELLQRGLERVEEGDRVFVDLPLGLADQLAPGFQLGLVLAQLLQRIEPAFDRPPLLEDDFAFSGVFQKSGACISRSSSESCSSSPPASKKPRRFWICSDNRLKRSES